MAHKSLLPKQRCLTDHETQTSFDAWRESMIFHISLSDKSTRFLSTGDLKTWTTAPDRGFVDDGAVGTGIVTEDNKMNKNAKVALLNIILGSLATYCPVISSKFIKNQSTCMESIWSRLRVYYGFRRAGSRILQLLDFNPEMNESRESLWERLYSFVEDQLLTKDGEVLHENIKRETDEEFTPTLLNILVTIWLRTINPSLPALVKQRFATQLRSSTVYTLREEISDSIPSIIAEMEEKDCSINRTGFNQKRQTRGGYQSKGGHQAKGGYQNSYQYNNRVPRKQCSLCMAAGKAPSDHFLSACPFLSPEDRKHISRTREMTVHDTLPYVENEYEEDSEENSEYYTKDSAIRPLHINLGAMSMNQGDGVREPQISDYMFSGTDLNPVNIRKVDVFASPVLDTTVNNRTSRWTLDSGAEANVISEEECIRLELEIRPTDQSATQGDGKTPLPVIGEVHFIAMNGHHRLFFNGLVVKVLDTAVLAGMPFHKINNVQINYSQNLIILEGCCKVHFDTNKKTHSMHAPGILRVARQTCVLPGEGVSFQLPEKFCKDEMVAIEPRTTIPKDMPNWIQCELVHPDDEGCVTIKNTTSEPVLISRHTQLCQARHTTTANLNTKCPQYVPISVDKAVTSDFNVHNYINLNNNTNMTKSEKDMFKVIHEEHSSVFTTEIGCYNNYSGEFKHVVNMSPNLPPQRRGRIPDYSKGDKEILQDEFDYLLSEGVFSRAEDVGQPVEFVHPSFLVKKSSGGHRLVTSFGEMANYCRPQPTVNSNIEHALHQIGQYEEIIITDLKCSYYQIPLNTDAARYVGVITPYKGTYVYRRSVMGLPGSEAALEELLSRIFGDLIRDGKMVKIADDLILGSQSKTDLAETWSEVLKRLNLNGLKLSPSKTKICPLSASILGWEWKSGNIQPGKHRVNALLSCDPPSTAKGMRSYLGCFKYISRVLLKYSEILHPLEESVAGKQPADKITWTDDLLTYFNRSKEHLHKVRAIVLPKRDDQLHIITDASNTGLAGTLCVLRNNKPAVAGFFSASLKRNQSKLSTCELEALAIAANIKHFSYQIRQSTKKTRILTDSRPCCLAYKRLLRGEFSCSPKLTTFLSVATCYSIEMLHISGSSNLFSDFASRNPVDCKSSDCSVCTFINETYNSSVGEVTVSDVLSGKTRVPFSTKSSWKKVQQACPDLVKVHELLTTGASVPKKKRNLTDIKRYMNCGISVLTGQLEGLLAIRQSTPFKPSSIRVVIPRAAADGLLTALHIQLNHPNQTQLKLAFTKEFFCLDLSDKAKEVTEQCFSCTALKNIPSTYHEQSTSIPAKTIASKFSADVIRRFAQFILIMREDITSYTEATIIKNETAEAIRDGLVLLASRLKCLTYTRTIIRTDPGTSLQTLHNDKSLNKFNLEIELGEAKNINKNPIAESAIREFHAEMVRLQPHGGKITETTLARAIGNMNNIIRQNKLSSREAWTKREMSSGDELNISDESLIKQKFDQRCSSHESSAKYKARGKDPKPLPNVELGQLAHIYSDRSKLRSRDKYLVTGVREKEVTLQKFTKDQFRNKEYNVKKSDLILMPPEKSKAKVLDNKRLCSEGKQKMKDHYVVTTTPTNPKYFQPYLPDSSDSSDDTDDDNMATNRLRLFLPNKEHSLRIEEIIADHGGNTQGQLPTNNDDTHDIHQLNGLDLEDNTAARPKRTTRAPAYLRDYVVPGVGRRKQRHTSV